jgi:Tfp pilus assembly protein PilO
VTKGKLSQNALIAIIVGGVLVFGLAAWFFVVHPQSGKVANLKRQSQDVQEKIDAYHQQVAAARSAPKIEVADVYRLAKAMPSKTDMPDLVLELSQLARDSGIQFDSIAPQAAVAGSGYTVVPIDVTFNGNFFNLADFLYRLRTLVDVHNTRLDATGRLFSVDTLSFAEAPERFPRIQAKLLIDAFVYGTADVPGATGVAGGTTATDTTSTTTTSTDTTSTTETSTTPSDPSQTAAAAGAP